MNFTVNGTDHRVAKLFNKTDVIAPPFIYQVNHGSLYYFIEGLEGGGGRVTLSLVRLS